MALEDTTTKVEGLGNGVTTVFPISPLRLFEPRSADGGTHDLEITRVNADLTEELLSEGTGTNNYSVSVASYPGTGSVVFPASGAARLPTGAKLVMKRKLRLKQYEDLGNNGPYAADTQEEMHDRHRMVDLQQQEEIDRAVKVPIGSSTDPDDLIAQLTTDAASAAANASSAAADAAAADAARVAAEAAAASITLPLPVSSGGTGATTAATARTALGVGAADSPAFAAVRSGDVGTGAASNLSLTTSGGTQARVDHVASANRAVVLAGSNGGNPLVTTTAGALTLSGSGGPLTYIYGDGFVEINHNVSSTNGLRVWCSHASYTENVLQPWTTRAGATSFDLIEAVSGNGSDVEFRVRGDGQVTADGSFTGGGADYAEFFEWADGNPSNEDRVGFAVVLVGAKVRKATNADPASSIVGVVSANPSVLGDAAWNKWSGKHVRDDFGRYVWETYQIASWVVVEEIPVEDGEEPRTREIAHSYAVDAIPSGVTVPQGATYSTAQRRTLSPDFDPAAPYVPRSERPEWSPIGLLGKLRLRKGQPAGDRWIKLRDVSAAVEEWLVR